MEAWHLFFAAIVVVLTPFLRLILFRGGIDDQERGRLPPGPPAVPLLGSTVWLTSSLHDPVTLFQRLVARHGPIISLRFASQLLVIVADRRLAHAALVERGVSLADRPAVESARHLGVGLGDCSDKLITTTSYGPVWRLLRRNLVSEMLHSSRFRLFAPARAWTRRVLVDKLREHEHGDGAAPSDVVEAFHYAVFCLFLLMCFGERLDEATVRALTAAERDLVLYTSSNMAVFAFFPAVTKHLFRGRLQRMHALQWRLKELFLPLINSRREYKKQCGEPRKESTFEHSYVDTLLDIKLPEDGNRALTDDEMVNLCSEFLNAGTDTTSTALQWIMAELVKNPSIQSKLYEEIKSKTGDGGEVSEEDIHGMPYLKAVVLEGLRKHPPGHMLVPHRAAEDMEVGGYLIPKGATVNFMVAEMGRDEEEWEKPMEFIPERFLAGGDGEEVDVTGSKAIRMMPFGAGRRICPGLNMAMLHLEYFVAVMVREFKWKEVAGDEVDFTEKREFTTVMAKPLRARLVPRRTHFG
ncbi:cytochrome P450 89A2-like [Oryza brachyantha]|uniref:Cytochrome P450 n=1 Tax=Oryza brachyantha TaxID=4533 RepID=J3N435_ORYBR|nr:cytochrome P450 89A2-like [Oryza brachyantha]